MEFSSRHERSQTDQSTYGHSDGESGQAVAEANNNFAGAGICPNCRLLMVKAGDEAIDRPDRLAEAIAFAVDSGASVIDVTTSALGQSPALVGAVAICIRARRRGGVGKQRFRVGRSY